MLIIYKLILLCHIWVMGITIATSEGMIFYSWRVWANKKIEAGQRIWETIFTCHWCAPSIHSLVAYLFAFILGIIVKFEWNLVFIYPLVVMGTSLLNGIVWSVYKLIESATKYYVNAEKLKYFEIKDRKTKYHEKVNQR